MNNFKNLKQKKKKFFLYSFVMYYITSYYKYSKIKESCDQGLEVTSEMMVDIIKLALKKTEEDNVKINKYIYFFLQLFFNFKLNNIFNI